MSERKYNYPWSIAREMQNPFTIASSLDPALSNHIEDVSVHPINIPGLEIIISSKYIIQIKQAFTEYCLKHTWGRVASDLSVCYWRMHPT